MPHQQSSKLKGFQLLGLNLGNRNKGKENGAGLECESQSHCFADKFGKLYTHSFGTDTQHD